MQSTLEMALETAKASGASQILRLQMRVGALTGVVPEALQFAFEALREGTSAAQAELAMETVPASCWCANCRLEFEVRDWLQECPNCHATSAELRHGLELELTSVEVT